MKDQIILIVSLICTCQLCGCSKDIIDNITPPINESVLIENFESNTYKNWIPSGNAFSMDLVPQSTLKQWGDKGFEGDHIMTSCLQGDMGIGNIKSPEFVVSKNYLNFLIGGGGDINHVYVALYVNNKMVLRESGNNSRTFNWVSWNITSFKGQNAYIMMVDSSSKAWGFIDADYFFMSDKPAVDNRTRTIKITKQYLNLPVSYTANLGHINMFVENERIYDFDIRIAGKDPDYWVYLDCSKLIGKNINISIPFNSYLNSEEPVVTDGGLNLIYQSDIPGESNFFYKETYRPVFHFTSKRGWLNDPNGLFYYNGVWHMSYQHNPFGTDWGNMHWGHAVSTDLVHWKETGEILIPDSLGTIFSGYAVVDYNNKLGYQQSDNKTIVVYYTSAGGYNYLSRARPFTQCMAYSTDQGYTWNKYNKNPIITEIAYDNRDPHIVWDDSDNQWIMVLFLTGNQYEFLTSTDLLNWQTRGTISIDNEWECPDLFKIKVENESNTYKWILMGVQNKYFVGHLSNGCFIPETVLQKQDLNNCYLAAHTFTNAPNDRHVQIGCIGGSTFPNQPFNEMMGFPRELKLYKTEGGFKLYNFPVEEIKNVHADVCNFSNNVLSDSNTFSVSGTAFHIVSSFNITNATASNFGFKINDFEVRYYTNSSIISMGMANDPKTTAIVPAENGSIRIDILVDNGLVETFINGGSYSGTFYFQPSNLTKSVSTLAENGYVKVNNLSVYKLKSIW